MANPPADAKPTEKDRPASEVKLLSKEEFEKTIAATEKRK